jgi:phosphoenolpyruvate carboxykinase (GTP)
VVRRDPMAMLAFCGYDMGTYFGHWLEMSALIADPPKLFIVNWFRKDAAGKFLWPGYGENMRVLEWVIGRSTGRAGAIETPVGWVPRLTDLDLDGLDLAPERLVAALRVDLAEWAAELGTHADWLAKLGGTVPAPLGLQRRLLLASIGIAAT